MTNNTRIYNRFTGYSTEDCRCEWCLHYGGKERPCLLDECCCMKERMEAAKREHGTDKGDTGRLPTEKPQKFITNTTQFRHIRTQAQPPPSGKDYNDALLQQRAREPPSRPRDRAANFIL